MLGKYSRYVSYVGDMYRPVYTVSDVFDNDFHAITTRLIFVQLRESSSMYAF